VSAVQTNATLGLKLSWPNILPHQFRTRNDRIKAQRRRAIQNENAGKSTNLTVILPLIMVWLQVRALSH
jgi:hypothetical protein